MKFLGFLSWGAIVLGVLLLIGAQVGQAHFARRAELTQRIAPYDAALAELTGELGEPIGQPQMMIIDDPKAFIASEPAKGARYVSEPYLKQNGIYPLQLKTVAFIAMVTRWVGVGALAAGLGLRFLVRRRQNKMLLSPV